MITLGAASHQIVKEEQQQEKGSRRRREAGGNIASRLVISEGSQDLIIGIDVLLDLSIERSLVLPGLFTRVTDRVRNYIPSIGL